MVMFLLVFGAYPLIELARMAFAAVTIRDGQFHWSSAGFSNFSAAFDDTVFLTSLYNSGVFVVATTVLTLVLGVVLAVLTDRATQRGGSIAAAARNVLIWPAIIAPVVVSVVWLLVLSPHVGALNKLLASIGLPEQGWLGSGLGAMASIIYVDVWHWTPVVYLLVYTALKDMDPEVYEAACIDGASDAQLFWHVTLPLLRPVLAVAAGIRVVMGVKAFDEMFLLTHGGPGTATTVLSIHIRGVFFDEMRLGYGAALSLIVVAFVVVGFLLIVAARRVVRAVRQARWKVIP
ncbi:carbohydrate ABC transporter permease [Streptomyces sp. NPDC056817]|uniref:carbohydrate ABC transporter permease n=1 Tax=Streptomyces sp. NPDC056817 TaxID=3345950 RepID=UPI0036A545B2